MLIKNLLARVAEKLTGRKCAGCKYNRCKHCTHPDPAMFDRCFSSITKPGFTGKYEKSAQPAHEANREALSEEEQFQFQKIQAALEEAGEIARESGLLEG